MGHAVTVYFGNEEDANAFAARINETPTFGDLDITFVSDVVEEN